VLAEEGAGCALMVSGEAGIGKSRFVAEIETRLRKAEAQLLVGECVEVAEGELAFAPIVAALRPVMNDGEAVHDLEPPLRAALAALWPALGDAGAGSREQLFEAIYRVLAGLARHRLVVVVVEDVHWIDRSSRDLLGFLVRNARRDRLLLVATYRPDELHRGHPLRPFLRELLVPVSGKDYSGLSAWCTTDCGCGRCPLRDAAASRWRSAGVRVPWALTPDLRRVKANVEPRVLHKRNLVDAADR